MTNMLDLVIRWMTMIFFLIRTLCENHDFRIMTLHLHQILQLNAE